MKRGPWTRAGKGTTQMKFVKQLLALGALLALSACGGNNSNTATVLLGLEVINLNGGAGGTGAGGNGGSITSFKNLSSVHGDLKFHASGTVDASFAVPTITPSFGANPATIAADTVVGSTTSTTPGQFYVVAGDNNLYLVGSTGTAAPVTGLTVNAGRKLSIPNTNNFTRIPGGIVINGVVTNTADSEALNLQSGSLIRINAGGKVTTTPTETTAGTNSGLLTLRSDGILINQGVVESNGADNSSDTVFGGSSGGVTLRAGTFLYNAPGTITLIGAPTSVSARGGANASGRAGDGGPVLLKADTASVCTSGAIDASGGDKSVFPAGTATTSKIGGNGGNITFIGGSATNVGRVAVEGTVTSNGGVGSSGNGGNGGTISLNSFTGGILISTLPGLTTTENALITMISAAGGKGSVNGGVGGSLGLNNSVGSDAVNQHQLSPEGIKVAGNISLNGGQGGAQGGQGGTLSFTSAVADNALTGFANVEFFGYQSLTLVGGNSTANNGGNGGIVQCDLRASVNVLGINFPPGGIFNEVPIYAKGGDNTAKSAGSVGGTGGTVQFTTPLSSNDPGDPTRTILTNLASVIDVSGGAAEIGGGPGRVTMKSFGNLINGGTITAGAITAVGGAGMTQGGGIAGAAKDTILVTLSSSSSVSNFNFINVSGGAGPTGGNAGGVVLASGRQTTNYQAITANGGASATHGGSGGFISLSSELLSTSEVFITSNTLLGGHLSVGSGGTGGTVGTILLDGTDITPAGGAI